MFNKNALAQLLDCIHSGMNLSGEKIIYIYSSYVTKQKLKENQSVSVKKKTSEIGNLKKIILENPNLTWKQLVKDLVILDIIKFDITFRYWDKMGKMHTAYVPPIKVKDEDSINQGRDVNGNEANEEIT